MNGRGEGRIPSATWRGMPCLENTWETNASVTSGAVTVSVVGLDAGNCSITSILIECHGRPGTCKGCSKP